MVAAVRTTTAPLVPRGRYAAARVRAAVAASEGRRTRAGTVVDGVLVLGCVAAAIVSIEGQPLVWALLPPWWVPLDTAVGVLASVALWWRRSHPVLLAGVLGVLGGVFIGAGVPAVIALYTVVTLRPLWVAAVIAGAHLSIAIPYYLVVPIGGMGLPIWTVTMVLLYTCCLAIGTAVRSRRQVIAGLVEAAESERLEHERRLDDARDAERARIAREMHDVLAHRLSILSVHAGALEHRSRVDASGSLTPEETREAATVIRSSAHAALTELRDVLDLLGATTEGELGTGAPQPTVADLHRLVAEARTSGQRVRLDLAGADEQVLAGGRPQLQRTLYRVVQEGLTNARKHASGAAVAVAIGRPAPDQVAIEVRNPLPVGVGATEVPGSRAGLAGLTERVHLDGGSLTTEIDDGAFCLLVRLPWRT